MKTWNQWYDWARFHMGFDHQQAEELAYERTHRYISPETLLARRAAQQIREAK